MIVTFVDKLEKKLNNTLTRSRHGIKNVMFLTKMISYCVFSLNTDYKNN